MNSHNPNDFRQRLRFPGEARPVVRTDFARFAPRTVTSESLFRGEHEIGIDHAGSLYRLKITRQGKLILNK